MAIKAIMAIKNHPHSGLFFNRSVSAFERRLSLGLLGPPRGKIRLGASRRDNVWIMQKTP